tara:strand:+ start:790 stop:1137 length:348 start_codon:yes stop_codon:yes gene_type:complete
MCGACLGESGQRMHDYAYSQAAVDLAEKKRYEDNVVDIGPVGELEREVYASRPAPVVTLSYQRGPGDLEGQVNGYNPGVANDMTYQKMGKNAGYIEGQSGSGVNMHNAREYGLAA